MESNGVERRIAMLRKAMAARRSPEDREHRSGAVKFGDAVTDLMAYLNTEQRRLAKERAARKEPGTPPPTQDS